MTAARALCLGLVVGSVLLLGGTASAATPQQVSQKIFADLADNGRLDGKYTRAQIARALRTPSLRGYEHTSPAAPTRAPASVPAAETSVKDGRGLSLPFSGIDVALLLAVGVPTLLLGASLGRAARVRPEGGPG